MAKKLLTKEQIKEFIKSEGLYDAKGISDMLTDAFKDVLQEVLEAEMDNHLGYEKYDWKNKEGANSRNGHTKKTVRTEKGKVTLGIPRDVNREFKPKLIEKNKRQLNCSIDDQIISLYGKGNSARDINELIGGIYKVNISSELVSKITDRIIPLAKEWQNRPLQVMYPVVFLDGIVFNVRENGTVVKKTGYVVYGINIEGLKEVLGIWIGDGESSKFWLSVLTDLKQRGVEDIIIACIDGLNGFVEAIQTVYPKTEIQRCVVHTIRGSVKYVPHKHKKEFCSDLKDIYKAINEDQALKALEKLEEKWGKKYPHSVNIWRDNWSEISTFFKYPPEIRKLIYTTNPIEGFNRVLRKVTKTKSSFPTENSLFKLLYLVVIDKTEKWTQPRHNWGTIVNQLVIYFGERVTKYL